MRVPVPAENASTLPSAFSASESTAGRCSCSAIPGPSARPAAHRRSRPRPRTRRRRSCTPNPVRLWAGGVRGPLPRPSCTRPTRDRGTAATSCSTAAAGYRPRAADCHLPPQLQRPLARVSGVLEPIDQDARTRPVAEIRDNAPSCPSAKRSARSYCAAASRCEARSAARRPARDAKASARSWSSAPSRGGPAALRPRSRRPRARPGCWHGSAAAMCRHLLLDASR